MLLWYKVYNTEILLPDSTENAIDTAAVNKPVEDAEDDDDDDDETTAHLTGETKCKSKFWNCVGKVVKEGSHYLQEPGGFTK